MHRTLIIGGVSPIGYEIAVNVKKQIRTCLQIVDDEALNIKNKLHWIKLNKFILLTNDYYKCDLLIINLYDLLGEQRNQSSKYQLYLSLFDKLFEIIKININIKIIVILNSEQYAQEDKSNNNLFSKLNSFVIDYLEVYTKLKKIPSKVIFLPKSIPPDYVDDLFKNIPELDIPNFIVNNGYLVKDLM